MSAEIIQFVPRPDPNREERLIKRQIEAAQAIYAEIFPDDTAPSEMNPDQPA